MVPVLCFIALQTIVNGQQYQWVGQMSGNSIDSKANYKGLYVDFSEAIAAKHLVLIEGQYMVFRVNENSCSYVGAITPGKNAHTEAGLK